MREYRVQTKFGDNEWRFATDRRGKYYTYDSLETAMRYGPTHYPRTYDRETRRHSYDYSRGRIVMSEIEWVVVSPE